MIFLKISRDAAELGIRNPVACIIENIQIRTAVDELASEIEAVDTFVRDNWVEMVSTDESVGFVDLFTKMGYHAQNPAGHRLLQSVKLKGLKHYNNLIDAYNIASVRFVSGIGMHDARQLGSSLRVFRASGSEQIIPLFKTTPVSVRPGDLVYSFDDDSPSSPVVAWLGARDVDSDLFKVTENTKSVVLVALGNAATSQAFNESVCATAIALIKRTCPEARATFLARQ